MTIPGTTVKVEMVPIPGGKFKMGSPTTEKGRKPDEGPQFEVVVEPFWMGKYPVTWAEYRLFMNLTDEFKGMEGLKPPLRQVDKRQRSRRRHRAFEPVRSHVHISQWPEAAAAGRHDVAIRGQTIHEMAQPAHRQLLSNPQRSRMGIRLPGPARRRPIFSATIRRLLGKYGWFFDNSNETTHEVGLKLPNPWGLYDMCGNVGQWVLDQHLADGYKKFAGKTVTAKEAIVWPTKLFPRVLRGGSWDSDAADCRSAARRKSDDVAWREIDPNIPKSPWWFTEAEALSVGMRIIRPLSPPADAERAKYWEADLTDITEDANDRLHQGRGAKGIVDPKLPDDIKRLEQSSKHYVKKIVGCAMPTKLATVDLVGRSRS